MLLSYDLQFLIRLFVKPLLFGTILIIVSCASKPSPHEASTSIQIQKAFEETQKVGKLAIVDTLPQIFTDEKLEKIINTVVNNNLSIESAKADLKIAGFSVDLNETGLLPTVSGSLSPSRSGGSSTGYKNNYRVSLDSSWEIDVWGKTRDKINSAKFTAEIQQESINNIKQSVVAQSVQLYFSIINLSRLIKIYENQHQSLIHTKKSIIEQFSLGISTADGIDSASSSASSSLQKIENTKNSKRNAIKQLNILMGKYPSNRIDIASNYPKLNKTVAAGIPSEVLLRRPDIKSAFLSVRKADNDALVSYKDMFPKLSLSASLSRSSEHLRELAHGNLNIWSLAGNLVQPLFDANLRKIRLKQNSAIADKAYSNYQNVILNALLEVEKSLDSEASLKKQITSANRTVSYARAAEKRIREGYANSLNTIFDLLNAKQTKYNAIQSVEILKLQRYQNRVSLALALGKAY